MPNLSSIAEESSSIMAWTLSMRSRRNMRSARSSLRLSVALLPPSKSSAIISMS